MASFSQIVRFDAMRSVAFGAITAGFLPFGTPLGHRNRIIKFTNTTNSSVILSYDGATENDIVTAGGFCLYDFTSNASAETLFATSVGTQLFIKYATAPTSGSVYVTCAYGQGE